MSNSKELSTMEIVNRGWLLVNIPSIIIILVVWFCLAAYLEINGKISAIIGGALGWIYWEFTIKKWIKWALNNDVEPDRLLKIGQFSLLLWNSRQIDKILKEKK
jgi:hypothetical protein